MSTTTVYPLGTDAPEGWDPQEIIYYKLSFGISGGLQFTYLEGSGIQSGSDIEDFIANVLAGTVSGLSSLSYQDSAPNVVVRQSCYVVIVLDSSLNWRFTSELPGLQTEDDLSERYFGLVHVDTSGNETDGEAPASDSTSRIAYFGVSNPLEAPHVDPFNLYVEFDTGFGQTLPIVLDPDIKNDGGPPSLSRKASAKRASKRSPKRRNKR